jgi:hypothetical protein
MGEFEQIFEAQRVIGERAVIMVCDYTPTDMEAYFADLFAGLRPQGAIVATYPSAAVALKYGTAQVEPVRRDSSPTAGQAWQTITRIAEEAQR